MGDLLLKHNKPKGFSVMAEVFAEGNSAIVKVGKIQKGWVEIIKYYIKIECQDKGQTRFKKLRSQIFDFPTKWELKKPRTDFFQQNIPGIFKSDFNTRASDDEKSETYDLVVKAYG